MPSGACCCIHLAGAIIADISKHHIFAPFLGIFRRTAAKYNIIFAVIANTIAIIRLTDNSQGISLGGIKSAEAVHINNYTLALKDQLIGVNIAQAHQLGVSHRLILLQLIGYISIFGPSIEIIYFFVGNMQAANINFRTVANLHAVGVYKIDIAALLTMDIGIQLAVNLRAFAAGNIVQHIKIIMVTIDSHAGIGTNRKAVPGDNSILRRLVQIHLAALHPTGNIAGNNSTYFAITRKHVIGNNAIACGAGNPWH